VVVKREVLELAQRALDCLCGCSCTCDEQGNKCPRCEVDLVKFHDQDCCLVCYAQKACANIEAALDKKGNYIVNSLGEK